MYTYKVGENIDVSNIVYLNDLYIAVMTEMEDKKYRDKLMVSYDYLKWRKSYIDGDKYTIYPSIVFTNGLYLIYVREIKENGKCKLLYSKDCLMWKECGLSNIDYVHKISAGDGVFCCVYSENGTMKLVYSFDAIEWKHENRLKPTENIYNLMTHNKRIYVMYGGNELVKMSVICV